MPFSPKSKKSLVHSRIGKFNTSLALKEPLELVSTHFWRPSDAFSE
ncbi:hypothetical protein BD01_1998 [Thermococcus nautili]|uniref:Uncharacterized protein n=1 Tax=Thermococcus nautili TaxID=195522 RepID=W8NWL2_9EURY|nr:hypothetical protein BD01_1998 [Thermococcus nautili]